MTNRRSFLASFSLTPFIGAALSRIRLSCDVRDRGLGAPLLQGGLFDMSAWKRANQPLMKIGRDFPCLPLRCFIGLDVPLEAGSATVVAVFKGNASGVRILTWSYASPMRPLTLDAISKDIGRLIRQHDVRGVIYDPQAISPGIEWQSKAIEFPQTVGMMSPATKGLMESIRSGNVEHNGDPALTRALASVVGRWDANGNVYPVKLRKEDKIGPAVALIMAHSRAVVVA